MDAKEIINGLLDIAEAAVLRTPGGGDDLIFAIIRAGIQQFAPEGYGAFPATLDVETSKAVSLFVATCKDAPG